jgi:hypothetical protein
MIFGRMCLRRAGRRELIAAGPLPVSRLHDDRRREHERTAGQLRRPERGAERREGQRHRHDRLQRREDRRGRRAGARQPGEEEADGADGRDQRDRGDPAEACGAQTITGNV